MTWHFFTAEEVACTSCTAPFVPYESPHVCPRCGSQFIIETTFLSDVVGGLLAHKGQYGSYTSGAYYIGSPAENIFHWCCRMLDAASEGQPGLPTRESVRQVLESMDWTDQADMKKYFAGLLDAVLVRLSASSRENP